MSKTFVALMSMIKEKKKDKENDRKAITTAVAMEYNGAMLFSISDTTKSSDLDVNVLATRNPGTQITGQSYLRSFLARLHNPYF